MTSTAASGDIGQVIFTADGSVVAEVHASHDLAIGVIGLLHCASFMKYSRAVPRGRFGPRSGP